jgi:FSR family fosmidomycin resistance protein-like MFS transporter
MSAPTERSPSARPWKRTGLLFAGHLLNDGFSGFFAPLLPLLIDRLDLSLALAGALGAIRILTNSLLQPGLGHLVDRVQRPWLVIAGPSLTVVAMVFIGRASSYVQLLVIMLAAGVGTALFHPAAAALVAAGNHDRRGMLMAFFSSGGTLGGAIAPIAVAAFVDRFSLPNTPWLLVPGVAILLSFALPLGRTLPPSVRGAVQRATLRDVPARLVLLWLAIVLSSTCSTAFATFLAVLIAERGGTALAGGAAITVFLFSGAVTGLLAGNLSDRFGRRRVILTSLALATPFYLLFLYGPVPVGLVFIASAGVFGLSSIPVGVVAAQECLPGRTGLVSGLMMGLAWGVGGLALTPIGWLADRFGIIPVMAFVSFLPLAAAGLMTFYRDASMSSGRADLVDERGHEPSGNGT